VSKAESKASREKIKDIRDELAHADMAEFDRMIEHLISVPKEKIDQAEKKRSTPVPSR